MLEPLPGQILTDPKKMSFPSIRYTETLPSDIKDKMLSDVGRIMSVLPIIPTYSHSMLPAGSMSFIKAPYRTLDTSMKFPEGTQFRLFKKGGVIKAQDGAKTIPEDLKKPIITPELRSKVESQILPSTKADITPMSIEQLRPAISAVVQGQTTNDTSKLDLKNIGDQILRGLEAATVGNAIRKDADIKRKALKDVGEILNKTEAPSNETLR